MENQIELAKSWFVLSQLSMILAGFLFASAGIAWTSSINTLNTAIPLTNDFIKNSNCINNFNLSSLQLEFRNDSIQYFGEMVTINLKIFYGFIFFAIIFVIMAIVYWFVGYDKIKKLNSSNSQPSKHP